MRNRLAGQVRPIFRWPGIRNPLRLRPKPQLRLRPYRRRSRYEHPFNPRFRNRQMRVDLQISRGYRRRTNHPFPLRLHNFRLGHPPPQTIRLRDCSRVPRLCRLPPHFRAALSRLSPVFRQFTSRLRPISPYRSFSISPPIRRRVSHLMRLPILPSVPGERLSLPHHRNRLLWTRPALKHLRRRSTFLPSARRAHQARDQLMDIIRTGLSKTRLHRQRENSVVNGPHRDSRCSRWCC